MGTATKPIEGEIVDERAMSRYEPAQLLALAIQKDLDIEKLERLMELQERWQREQAKVGYYEALTRFQSVVPRIPRKKQVKFNQTSYSYAPLADVDETIRPAMLECGLSKRWEIQDSGDVITVTCIVSHALGHSETTTMTAAPDVSGAKNAIQARGSTVAYLQRYTLIGALGLSTADEDIDARLGNGNIEVITESQAADLLALISEVKADKTKFLRFMQVDDVKEIRATEYKRAVKALDDKRKAAR